MRKCTRCGLLKPLEEYRKRLSRPGGTGSQCRVCMREQDQSYRQQDPARQRKYNLLYYHSITTDRFDEILRSQDGTCAICNVDTPSGRGNWHVDHDHSCCPSNRSCGLCIRGLLCHHCNIAIGNLHDDPDLLLVAVAYLQSGPRQDNPDGGVHGRDNEETDCNSADSRTAI